VLGLPRAAGPVNMAATSVISRGRLIHSLGSAWSRAETESYGLPWDEHDDRVARRRDALLIARSLWTQDETTLEGRLFRLVEPSGISLGYVKGWSERGEVVVVPRTSRCWIELSAEERRLSDLLCVRSE
jgi:hypothetical protein